MKNYAEIHADLREEIMQQIDSKVDDLFAKYEVESIFDIEGFPRLSGFVLEYVDDGEWGDGLECLKVIITDIFVGGECAGYVMNDTNIEPYGIYEFTTDSLIEILEELNKFDN